MNCARSLTKKTLWHSRYIVTTKSRSRAIQNTFSSHKSIHVKFFQIFIAFAFLFLLNFENDLSRILLSILQIFSHHLKPWLILLDWELLLNKRIKLFFYKNKNSLSIITLLISIIVIKYVCINIYTFFRW